MYATTDYPVLMAISSWEAADKQHENTPLLLLGATHGCPGRTADLKSRNTQKTTNRNSSWQRPTLPAMAAGVSPSRPQHYTPFRSRSGSSGTRAVTVRGPDTPSASFRKLRAPQERHGRTSLSPVPPQSAHSKLYIQGDYCCCRKPKIIRRF